MSAGTDRDRAVRPIRDVRHPARRGLPWPGEAVDALRLGVTSIVAIYFSMLFELDTPEWAGWTVLSVSLATRASSLQKSLWRAIGSVVGGEISIVLVANFAQSTLAFDVALAIWLAIVTTASSIERGQQSYGFALMGFTVPIVTLGDVQTPDAVFHVAVDRCSTLLIGIGCAHVSMVAVARGVRRVNADLATEIDAVRRELAGWFENRTDPSHRPPPLASVLRLDDRIQDAFTEQPSLRTRGRPLSDVPNRCLRLVAACLLSDRLHLIGTGPADHLLGTGVRSHAEELAWLGETADWLRAGVGRRGPRAPVRPLARDWDGRQAIRNGIRAAISVSLMNAFWYWSEWPAGADAVTWAALLSVLLGARPDAPKASRDFLFGAALAAIVGLPVRYTALSVSGVFALLAAVLLPLLMLAAMGRADKRAAIGAGYGFLILTVIGPANVMHYDLGASVNTVVADLLGMGTAVVVFSSVLPPADGRTTRARAMRRMEASFRHIARTSAWLAPRRYAYLSRMCDRLVILGGSGDDRERMGRGEALLLAGLLVAALRASDDALGRAVAASLAGAPEARDAARSGLLARVEPDALAGARIAAAFALADAAFATGGAGRGAG